MSLAGKLQLGSDVSIRVLHRPAGVALGDVRVSKTAGGVLVFVTNSSELASRAKAVVSAALEDAVSWVAYPKGGLLGTDLNRDVVWSKLQGHGIRPVRQVSLDDVWSALRFRPGSISSG